MVNRVFLSILMNNIGSFIPRVRVQINKFVNLPQKKISKKEKSSLVILFSCRLPSN
jgi:hypothetical protein